MGAVLITPRGIDVTCLPNDRGSMIDVCILSSFLLPLMLDILPDWAAPHKPHWHSLLVLRKHAALDLSPLILQQKSCPCQSSTPTLWMSPSAAVRPPPGRRRIGGLMPPAGQRHCVFPRLRNYVVSRPLSWVTLTLAWTLEWTCGSDLWRLN